MQSLIKFTTEHKPAVYNVIAPEYYTASLHPTCNTFRSGSILLLKNIIATLNNKNNLDVLELGAGKSIIPDVFPNWQSELGSLTLLDESEAMLAHSEKFVVEGARKVIGNACAANLTDRSFGLILSNLGDPYNTPALWKEANRLLKRSGIFVFITPAFEWASEFRASEVGSTNSQAKFALANGKSVITPSFIYDVTDQRRIARDAGFTQVDHIHLSKRELSNENIAPKINFVDEDCPILTAYICNK